ncbi:MAG: SGNH/GDSL hydrolase family protein, partial [Sandaracinobacteroides sp.]
MQLAPSATFAFYGDSISDIRAFGSFNVSLGRSLEGRIRFAENAGISAHVDLGTRPGWNLAVSGATVSGITQRVLA